MRDLGLAHRADLSHLLLFLPSPLPQLFHDLCVQLCVEEFAEDELFVVGFCPQKLHELSLCDHGDLHELALRQPHDLFQLPVRLFLRVLCPVRHGERHALALFLYPCPALQRPDMPWHPSDRVLFPVLFRICFRICFRVFSSAFSRSLCEDQLHVRLCPGVDILALELCPVLLVHPGACLPVESEYNSVKYGRLSSPCVPGDQEKVLVRLFKINDRPLPVGTERLHSQSERPHSCITSCTVLITSRRSAFSSSSGSFRKAQHNSKGSSSS